MRHSTTVYDKIVSRPLPRALVEFGSYNCICLWLVHLGREHDWARCDVQAFGSNASDNFVSVLSQNNNDLAKRYFPNGVFQIPHLGLRQRKPLRGTKHAWKPQSFKAFWCLLPLRILTNLWMHHSEKQSLENTICYSLDLACWHKPKVDSRRFSVGNGPNTAPESTVSNTEVSEFFF